jgi:hypothetical protein
VSSLFRCWIVKKIIIKIGIDKYVCMCYNKDTKKEKEIAKMYNLYLQREENGPIEVKEVDPNFLTWFVETGKDLDYFKAWAEEIA